MNVEEKAMTLTFQSERAHKTQTCLAQFIDKQLKYAKKFLVFFSSRNLTNLRFLGLLFMEYKKFNQSYACPVFIRLATMFWLLTLCLHPLEAAEVQDGGNKEKKSGSVSICDTSDLYLYGVGRTGERPYLKGDIGTVGVMYFEDLFREDKLILFADAKWSNLEKKADDVTFGVGARFCFPRSKAVLGLNTYFDYLDTEKGNFRQAGAGFELLSYKYDIRANAYFPVGKKEAWKERTYDDYVGEFIVICKRKQKSLKGYDAEIGRRFCLPCGFFLYPALGGYYFDGCCNGTYGGMARIAIGWRENVNLEGEIYHDKIHGTIGELRLTASVALNRLLNLFDSHYCWNPIRQFVRRRDYIVTDQCCRYETNY